MHVLIAISGHPFPGVLLCPPCIKVSIMIELVIDSFGHNSRASWTYTHNWISWQFCNKAMSCSECLTLANTLSSLVRLNSHSFLNVLHQQNELSIKEHNSPFTWVAYCRCKNEMKIMESMLETSYVEYEYCLMFTSIFQLVYYIS